MKFIIWLGLTLGVAYAYYEQALGVDAHVYVAVLWWAIVAVWVLTGLLLLALVILASCGNSKAQSALKRVEKRYAGRKH